MASHTGPNCPIGDLAIYLDATNPDTAYGTTWLDMSGNGKVVTAYGSPAINTLGGVRCFDLNQTGDRFVINNESNQSTNNLTFEAWIYPAASELTSGDRGAIIQGYAYLSWNKGNRRMSSYWYSTNNQGYHEPSLQMNREEWYHLVGVWDASTNNLYQYINGELENTVATTPSSGLYYQSLNIGWEGDGRQFSGGIGMIKIYKRTLSSTEVLDFYNNTKSRFGR